MSLSEYDLLRQLWELRQQESNTCQQPPSSKGGWRTRASDSEQTGFFYHHIKAFP